MDRPSATRRSGEARRASIIAAARHLFAQHGFQGTGMAQIARKSKVQIAQIYRDFGCKEDLIGAIIATDLSRLLDDAELSSGAESNAAQLLSWVRNFIRLPLDEDTRRILANILSEATLNTKYSMILVEAYASLRTRLLDATRVWAARPEDDDMRRKVVDFILTVAGALHHRQIIGLPQDGWLNDKMIHLVEEEMFLLRSSNFPAGQH